MGRSRSRKQLPHWWQMMLAAAFFVAVFSGLRAVDQHELRAVEARERDLADKAAAELAAWQAMPAAEQLAKCRTLWIKGHSLGWRAEAAAWSPGRFEALVRAGLNPGHLQHLVCAEAAGTLGPRYRHPKPTLQAEQGADGAGGAPPDALVELAGRLARLPAEGGPRSIEVQTWVDQLDPLVREVGGDGAVRIEPAGVTPVLPWLLLPSRSTRAEAPLPVVPKFAWDREIHALFLTLTEVLPPEARIVEMSLAQDRIDFEIEGPLPDRGLNAERGEIELDAWGDPVTWLYPREAIGFGCPRGVSVAELEAAFRHAATLHGLHDLASGQQRYRTAWYSCSPAYSDGQTGVWHLDPVME
jgi:hypothetical protein